MRITVVFIICVTLFVSTQATSKTFNFGGWSGVVESMGKIDGVQSENHDEISSKAEQAIKKIIEKHLAGKKQAKQQARKKSGQQVPPQQQQQVPPQEQQQVPPQQQSQQTFQVDKQDPISHVKENLPQNINWDEHKETRDAINQKVPGGTAAVDALIKLLHESKSH